MSILSNFFSEQVGISQQGGGVKHILKDGTVLEDITGTVVKSQLVNQILERIKERKSNGQV